MCFGKFLDDGEWVLADADGNVLDSVDGDDCGACGALHNVNAFFRGIAKTFGFIIFGNIGTNILFPWLHKHFHHWFNPNK